MMMIWYNGDDDDADDEIQVHLKVAAKHEADGQRQVKTQKIKDKRDKRWKKNKKWR